MMVRLSPSEMEVAAFQGVKRRIRAIAKGRTQAHAYDGRIDPWVMDVEGAAAEFALAKALGRYFPVTPRLDTDAGDLGSLQGVRIQVRSTLRTDGCLIVHPSDTDGDLFFLVRGRMPQLEIPGCVLGKVAKDRRFWRSDTGRPAYFVPDHILAIPPQSMALR